MRFKFSRVKSRVVVGVVNVSVSAHAKNAHNGPSTEKTGTGSLLNRPSRPIVVVVGIVVCVRFVKVGVGLKIGSGLELL